jgi:hypothetical protein
MGIAVNKAWRLPREFPARKRESEFAIMVGFTVIK